MRNFKGIALGLWGLFGWASPSLAAEVEYVFTDLGTLGGDESYATAINSDGVVVGWSTVKDGTTHAFFWDGAMHDLGLPPGYKYAEAAGINDSGVIVGLMISIDVVPHGFAYDGAEFVDLGVGRAWGINADGIIVGSASSGWVWDSGSRFDLDSVEGMPPGSEARAINASGLIAGFSKGPPCCQPTLATFWTDAVPTLLGDLGGAIPSSHGYAINNKGQVVGSSTTPHGAAAFLWDPATKLMKRLVPQEEDSLVSAALGINDDGVVVGYSSPGASVWDATKGLRRLNEVTVLPLGWTLWMAKAVNNSGTIAGWAWVLQQGLGAKKQRAFLLTRKL
jgi:probable HAF family extracellular repeat protein